jgi:hypothetical protein
MLYDPLLAILEQVMSNSFAALVPLPSLFICLAVKVSVAKVSVANAAHEKLLLCAGDGAYDFGYRCELR